MLKGPWMFLLSLCLAALTIGEGTHEYWDYIIIGAGPAGLQLGYFMKEAGRDYMILERGSKAGNFFEKYPRHDKLISINKRNTGKTNKEFNLRHDWNSLISDNESLLMKHYTKDFFPPRKVYLQYLQDYQSKLGLKVRFNVDVGKVASFHNDTTDQEGFTMIDQEGNEYRCRNVIIATGMWKPKTVKFKGMELTEGYEDISTNPEDYEGQSVVILGNGNAAFEVADSIIGATNLIHIISRSRIKLAWSTHYVGDLRAVNNAMLDTYQLKSLDGIAEADVESVVMLREGNKIRVIEDVNITEEHDNLASREPYDRVIRCLGFEFDSSIFQNSSGITRSEGKAKKYAGIDHDYQSMDYPGMYYAGTNTHSLDFKKSAGGFIHGFRYTARALHKILEWKNHQVAWPSTILPIAQIIPTIFKRINEGSGIYQMYSMLGDVIAFREDGSSFEYFEEFPLNKLHEFETLTGKEVKDILVMSLEYGKYFSGPGADVFRSTRATGSPSDAHNSNFLHPVFYYFKALPSADDMNNRGTKDTLPKPDALHHIVEDFLTTFDGLNTHILPTRRFIEKILNKDMRHFFPENCFMQLMTNPIPSPMCKSYFLNGASVSALDSMMPTMAVAETVL